MKTCVEVSPTTHEIKYTISGMGRSARTMSHVINKETQKSLCGRDGSEWCKMEWTRVECSRCQNAMGEEDK